MQFIAALVRGMLALGVTLAFLVQADANPVPVEEAAGVIQMTGTVEAIVVPTRLITVLGPDGSTVVGVISPDVKDIEKIKLKDTVTISFTEEVAVALRKADGPPKTTESAIEDMETADMGLDAPTVAEQDWVEMTPSGASDLTTVEVTDTVAAVNRRKRTITFAGKSGNTRTISVPPGIEGFDQIEPGDRIVVLATRAVVVDVDIS